MKIGRAVDNDIVLNSPSVSRHHAILSYASGNAQQPTISDSGSTNGTFVNGELLEAPRLVEPQDLIAVGSFLLSVRGREVRRQDLGASRLTAFQVGKTFGDKTVLQDISLSIYPREFVGLMGPSGCGKTTLMNALNGMSPATSGQVFINELDLYRNFDSLRLSIGYVPQRDILHEALTVERTLFYAAKLRLPAGTPPEQVQGVIDEVIQTIGLDEHRLTAFRQLSGGQQKRLSLGIELITKPTFLFLDEPTSPLDPETTENMMTLFRRLADEGRIVVMVTHKFEKFEAMHQVVLLTKGGHLAFFGSPREALNYFNCSEPAQIYHRMAERDPQEWSRNFRQSPQFQQFVNARLAETGELIRSSANNEFPVVQTGAERKFGFGQWLTLTQRYLEIKLKDKRNTLLLLLQAPIIAFILSIITESKPNEGTTLFISAIIAIWFGANNAIREIVSETAIYTRERLVNLKIPSYVFSKFAVLSGIGLIQCLLFVGILMFLGRFEAADFLPVTLILYLTLLAGVAVGLFFSALVNSTEKAMSILPLILIPQLLLSGFLKPLDDIYVNVKAQRPATVSDYDKYQADKDKKPKIDPNNPAAQPKIPEPIEKRDGLGAAKFVAGLMVARWTMEALAHQVSINDEKARDTLASRMTMVEYERVFEAEPPDEIESGYRRRVLIDAAVLLAFSAIFLLLTIVRLKRRDVL
ncbi:MAG: ATP-binding cassette domain-containing protein [Acidobacteriota bacterium]|nr:ATP-binding cassette domain-containing protein [Acidobacteriota bacterium]